MWPNPQETADLVTFTEEILNRKLHFLSRVKETGKICPAWILFWQDLNACYRWHKPKVFIDGRKIQFRKVPSDLNQCHQFWLVIFTGRIAWIWIMKPMFYWCLKWFSGKFITGQCSGKLRFHRLKLALKGSAPQNGQTHSNNSSARPFCGVGAQKFKKQFLAFQKSIFNVNAIKLNHVFYGDAFVNFWHDKNTKTSFRVLQ